MRVVFSLSSFLLALSLSFLAIFGLWFAFTSGTHADIVNECKRKGYAEARVSGERIDCNEMMESMHHDQHTTKTNS